MSVVLPETASSSPRARLWRVDGQYFTGPDISSLKVWKPEASVAVKTARGRLRKQPLGSTPLMPGEVEIFEQKTDTGDDMDTVHRPVYNVATVSVADGLSEHVVAVMKNLATKGWNHYVARGESRDALADANTWCGVEPLEDGTFIAYWRETCFTGASSCFQRLVAPRYTAGHVPVSFAAAKLSLRACDVHCVILSRDELIAAYSRMDFTTAEAAPAFRHSVYEFPEMEFSI